MPNVSTQTGTNGETFLRSSESWVLVKGPPLRNTKCCECGKSIESPGFYHLPRGRKGMSDLCNKCHGLLIAVDIYNRLAPEAPPVKKLGPKPSQSWTPWAKRVLCVADKWEAEHTRKSEPTEKPEDPPTPPRTDTEKGIMDKSWMTIREFTTVAKATKVLAKEGYVNTHKATRLAHRTSDTSFKEVLLREKIRCVLVRVPGKPAYHPFFWYALDVEALVSLLSAKPSLPPVRSLPPDFPNPSPVVPPEPVPVPDAELNYLKSELTRLESKLKAAMKRLDALDGLVKASARVVVECASTAPLDGAVAELTMAYARAAAFGVLDKY